MKIPDLSHITGAPEIFRGPEATMVDTPAETSQEERILRMMKKVLTDVAKDTHAKPGFRHSLSDHTIQGIRDCLALIAARERELAEAAGRPMNMRPHFVDEPRKTVVVPLNATGLKKPNPSPEDR